MVDIRAEKEILISVLREVVAKSSAVLTAHQSDPSPLSASVLQALRSLSNHITLFSRCVDASSLAHVSSQPLAAKLLELRRELTGGSTITTPTVSLRAEKVHLDLTAEAYRTIFLINGRQATKL